MSSLKLFAARILVLSLIVSVWTMAPLHAQSEPTQESKTEDNLETQTQKALLELARDVYVQVVLAQSSQLSCAIMEVAEENALNWYARQIRNYLILNESASAVSTLHLEAQGLRRKQKAHGQCDKDLMVELGEILEQAEFVNSNIGGQPFDRKQAALVEITTGLKLGARIKGAFLQCASDGRGDQTAQKILQQVDQKMLFLSAIAMVNGAPQTLFARLASIQRQTAKQKKWRSECKISKLFAVKKTLETITAQYKE